jgi:hypothetical protein
VPTSTPTSTPSSSPAGGSSSTSNSVRSAAPVSSSLHYYASLFAIGFVLPATLGYL